MAHLSTCAATANGQGCENVTCANAPTKTSDTTCTNYHPTCHYHNPSGTATCYAGNYCADYTMSPVSGCTDVVTNTGVKCKAPGSGACADGLCADKSNTDKTTCNGYKVKYTTGVTYLTIAA
jgi:hypothetical protein